MLQVTVVNDRLDQFHWSITLPALGENGEPMLWNLFLAFIPLALSMVLFYKPRSPMVRWGIWLLLGITAVGSYPRLQPLFQRGRPIFEGSVWLSLGAITLVGGGLALAYVYRQHAWFKALAWWLGVAVFVVFLPNAAYILTDVIHLVIDIRKGYPMGTVVLFLIPQYGLFMLAGFQAYGVSLMHLEFYLLERGLGQWILGCELAMNGLSAIGVYLGRFARLNSWDLLTDPIHLAQVLQAVLLSRHALVVIAILFGLFTALQGLLKRINLGLMQQKQVF